MPHARRKAFAILIFLRRNERHGITQMRADRFRQFLAQHNALCVQIVPTADGQNLFKARHPRFRRTVSSSPAQE